MYSRRFLTIFGVLLALGLLLVPLATASSTNGSLELPSFLDDGSQSIIDDGNESSSVKTSHRLIVQLNSPSLAEWSKATGQSRMANGRLNVRSSAARAYMAQLEAEQATFLSSMTAVLPNSSASHYINEKGETIDATYQVVLNAVSIDPGTTNSSQAIKTLSALPGVKMVYRDYAYSPTMYASLPLINAMALWNSADIGGIDNAGAGVKVASMDGGVHHEAAMFDGTGFDYPAGWPSGGLGDSANNNGKIIASRAYFRDWDPPAPGDENVWPGENGTPHGVHTASTAAGNPVTDVMYGGINVGEISGVAPAAWVMSYRVFYASVNGNASFFTTEGMAALEDIAMDGADVLNNSWGEGPTAAGGEFDALDQALINTVNAGVFVSMSAGNSGPGNGTTDHPSDEYIIVAASTTSGTLASGKFNVSAPEPVPNDLLDMNFASASFGAPLPIGEVNSYSYVTAASIGDGSNFDGCDAWPAGTFDGVAAVISRGTCEFGVKVLNAEQAGAEFVVVHNHATGGDELISMGAGAVGDQVTISSIFVGNTNGLAIVDWYAQHGAASQFELDTLAFQAGNTPDIITSFSSRGPGVGHVLKPDIAAPGVNILAQGYTPGASGEARHLGYGQVSGTSMASPHVAGAAALLRQVHPDWSNADIKSALMSTSKYMDIYNFDGTPAQPLDMGAGRLDLTNAADPGVMLSPPSLSFGLVQTGTNSTIEVMVTSVASETETYDLSTLYTGDGFTMTSDLAGFTVTPASITLAPGASATVTVEFDADSSMGVGDNQGYIIMEGDNGHDAHMAAWARVTPLPSADILIIDNDASSSLGRQDYLAYYTSTLDELNISYDVWDADINFDNPTTIPDPAVLASYKAIIYFTGDNYQADGSFTVSTALTALDMDNLTQYANGGGIVIAMGQDMSGVLNSDATDNGTFLYNNVLGANWLQDSVTAFNSPAQPITPFADAPLAFNDIWLDLKSLNWNFIGLTGGQEVPPVATTAYGGANLSYDEPNNFLRYGIEIYTGEPLTLTNAHIHTGTIGNNGPSLHSLFPFTQTQYVTDTLAWGGEVILTDAQEEALLSGGLYINVHSTAHPAGEVRGQLLDIHISGDGAGNQIFIDEIQGHPPLVDVGDPNMPEELEAYTALLQYPGSNNLEDGIVAVAHREQPSLEQPGISYFGRSIYTSFGLEGVNNGVGGTSRAELLGTFLDWAMDEPEVTIETGQLAHTTYFTATVNSDIDTTGVSYRWDFGDGSEFAGPFDSHIAGYEYHCGEYTVRVEATDSWGNKAIGSVDIEVTENCTAASSNLWILHLAPFAGGTRGSENAVDVTVTSADGTISLPNLNFGNTSHYIAVPSYMPIQIDVTTAGGTQSLFNGNIRGLADTDYTLAIIGDGKNQPFGLLNVTEEATVPTAGFANVRVVHAAPFASGNDDTWVDVRMGGEVVAGLTNVAYNSVSDYFALPAGEHTLQITTPGGASTLLEVPLSLSSEQSVTVFIRGDGTNEALSAQVLEPGTPTAVELSQLNSNDSGSRWPLALVGGLALLAGMTFFLKRRQQQ